MTCIGLNAENSKLPSRKGQILAEKYQSPPVGQYKIKNILKEGANFGGTNLKIHSRTIQNPHPTKPLSSARGLRNMTVKKNQSAPSVRTKIEKFVC